MYASNETSTNKILTLKLKTKINCPKIIILALHHRSLYYRFFRRSKSLNWISRNTVVIVTRLFIGRWQWRNVCFAGYNLVFECSRISFRLLLLKHGTVHALKWKLNQKLESKAESTNLSQDNLRKDWFG